MVAGVQVLGRRVTLEVSGLSNRGLGVARLVDLVVFVEGALPGERVVAEVVRERKRFVEARVLSVEAASRQRVEPRCHLFDICGGCQLQHLSLAAQRDWKRRFVADAWRRIVFRTTKFDTSRTFDQRVAEVSHGGAPNGYAYRSKLTPRRAGAVLGFARRDDPATLVDVDRCALATDAVNEALRQVRAAAPSPRERERERERDGICVGIGGGDVPSEGGDVPSEASSRPASKKKKKKKTAKNDASSVVTIRARPDGSATADRDEVVKARVAGCAFEHVAGGFFQVNLAVTEALVDHVRREVAGRRFLVDVYCGVGLFSVAVTWASPDVRCFGTEADATAVRLARHNAAANGVTDRCTFAACDATRTFSTRLRDDLAFDPNETCVLVDPPRTGLDGRFLRNMLRFRPDRIVYVSCDPATQARDGALILQDDYELTDLSPFDMFPHTRHVECSATFSRRPSRETSTAAAAEHEGEVISGHS